MEPPPGCLESPFGAAPPAHLLEGNVLVGVGSLSFDPRAPFVPGDSQATRYVEGKCCPLSSAASVGFESRTIALEWRGVGVREHRWAQGTH